MHNFTYWSPTEVVFGKDTENQTAAYVKKYGGSRVFIVYGGGSVVRSGLMGRVTAALDAAGIAHAEFGGVQPNPSLEKAKEGVAEAIKFGADFILGLGGGSAIDTAKGIAHGAANPDVDIWKYWTEELTVEKSLPVGVILTISAAGSETSSSSVLTNKATGSKRGLDTPCNRPKFAIMNPELTFTLPPYQVACGITDIMMHTLDRYFNPLDNELTDAIAEALLRTVIAKGAAAMKDTHDYDAMSEIMWAGSLSHNGLTGLGGTGDFAPHQLGHELSGMFDIAHGASLAVMWGHWAKYVCHTKLSRFVRYAENVWHITEGGDEEKALAGIQATADYFKSIGMPTCFSEAPEIGLQSEDVLKDLAWRCTFEGTRTIGGFQVLDGADILKIYESANV